MSVNNNYPQIAGIFALDAAVHGAVGALVNPAVGVTFGISYFLGSFVTDGMRKWLDSKNICWPFTSNETAAKVVKFAAVCLGGIALATAACSYLGASIVFSIGSNLSLAMLATTTAIATFVHNSRRAVDVIVRPPDLLSSIRC